jgi:hypothetical protein
MERLIARKLRDLGKAKRAEAAATTEAPPVLTTDPAFEEACKLYPIATKERGIVRFDPARWHDEQKRFNRERTGRDIVVKPRAVGMSTLEVLRGFHQVSTRDSWNVHVIIHDDSVADRLFQIVRLVYEEMRDAGRVAASRLDRVRELYFTEKSSGIAIHRAGESVRAAQKMGRSGTNHRVHATEVAYWKHPRETLKGFLGAVPSNGEVLIESTANGPSGLFYEEVQAALCGESEYKLHFYPWWQHAPYRLDALPEDFDPAPRDEWEAQLRGYGCTDFQIAWWRTKVSTFTIDGALQEFPIDINTCFRSTADAWFPPDILDAAAKHVRPPLRIVDVVVNGHRLGQLHVFIEPHASKDYLAGADVSEGIGKDGHAASWLDKTSGDVCATFHADSIEPGDFAHALAFGGRMYNTALLAPERNKDGAAVLRALEHECHYPRIYHAHDGRPGWMTTPVSRPIMWDEGWTGVRDGHLRTPDAATYAEMKTLEKDAKGRPAARGKGSSEGAKDDRWTGLIIAYQVLQESRVGGGVVSGLSLGAEADSLTSIM